MIDKEKLFIRQQAYVTPNTIRETPIIIIGIGSVGSNLVDIGMKAGFTNMTLCDIDTVETHNLPNQRFTERDIGQRKVDAMNMFLNNNSYQHMDVKTTDDFKSIDNYGRIVFSCVDSMEVRKEIFDHIKERKDWELFIDIRVGWFKYSIIPIKNNPQDIERYEATLNPDVKSTGHACGMETIINGVLGSANHAVQKALQFLQGEKELPNEIFVDVENDVTIKM